MDSVDLKQGDYDPFLNRRVEVLIMKSDDFVVYLDEDLETQWWATITWPEYAGRVFNRVSRLESISAFISDRTRLRCIRCQIGEAVARLLDKASPSTENDIASVLDDAEIEIKLRNRETSRLWFFMAATLFALAAVVPAFLLITFKESLELSSNGFEIVTTTLLGALGALGSICIRGNSLNLDANAGQSLHIIEAGARIAIGIIGAFMLVLMIKGGFVLDIVKTAADPLLLLWAFGIVAGASERIFPGLIKKGEDVALNTRET